MKVSVLVLATLLLIMPQAHPDSVTLNTGEVIQGDILSETDTQVDMRVVNFNRTITSRRTILKSEITKVERESTQQKVERRDYETLVDRLRLDPNREWSKSQYESGIEAFSKYLATYPESKYVGDVQKRLALWKDELLHVQQGEVKFAERWMTPEEKKPLLLTMQLAGLQRQRDSLAAAIEGVQGKITSLQRKLDTLQNSRSSDGRMVPNPERGNVESEIMSCAWQIKSDRPKLDSLDDKIQSTKSDLQQAQQAYEVVLAKSKEPPVQAAVDQPTPPPPLPAPPAAPKPEPWIVQNWKGFAIGGGILLVVLILVYPLKYILGRSARAEAERDQKRRSARVELKKVFDRILADGERPEGENTPDGEIVPIGEGENANGGGRWFVIGDAYIWAVQNNGRDGDNWALNNVVTSGRGAIGARIPMDPESADYINAVSKAAR